MKKLLALLVAALSSVTLHAWGVWIEETIDRITGKRTGSFEVNGGIYTIGPNADLRDVNFREVDLSGADLSDADLSEADLSNADLRFADLSSADLSGADLSDADLRNANLRGANLSGADLTRADLDNADLGDTIWNIPDPRIAELEAQLAAVTAGRDAAISERDARPTLEEVQDARVGSLVFRADEGANLLDLRFFIQSSENLQDWEITGECNFLLPMDTGKKFLRIALR